MSAKPPTACTVISYPESENGTKAYLRVVGQEEEVTLPLAKAQEQHRSFILSTWMKSYTPLLRKWLGKETQLLPEEAKQAETLWEQTYIVTSPNDDFAVHAWVCGSPGVLHYVYVPPELRGKGICRALIRHVCGHTFSHGRPWPFKKEITGGTYNPYILGQSL